MAFLKLRLPFGQTENHAEIEQAQTSDSSLEYWCRKFGDPELDEIVEDHRAWLGSNGKSGRKADLAHADFKGADLMGAELRGANLVRANLQRADLLLADLRGACLIEADLSEANLVSTNLRGASLLGANLSTATGLVARQLAGASLFGAALPESVYPFEGVSKAAVVSNVLQILLGTVAVLCLFLWAAVGATTDVQLIKNSPAPIPFAANVMPIQAFYLIGPTLLAAMYIAFHFYLQRLWSALEELPAVFPDGRRLSECVPVSMIAMAPRWLREPDGERKVPIFQRLFSSLVGYWMVPGTLVLIWARYLTQQDWRGSLLQIFFILAAAAMSGFLPGSESSIFAAHRADLGHKSRSFGSWHEGRFTAIASAGCIVLVGLSLGVILGVPRQSNRAPALSRGDLRRWPAYVFWAAGYDPFPSLSSARISDVSADMKNELNAVRGAQLRNASLRYAEASRAFFAKSAMQGSDLTGANLSGADFQGAILTSANLTDCDLSKADFQDADLTYAVLTSAIGTGAAFMEANFYDARLVNARLNRANLRKADLRGVVSDGAELNEADFTGAYMGGAKLSGASLAGARLNGAFLDGADLHSANLTGAIFTGAILSKADLTQANLDGADLRGALELTAKQVCSAMSHNGALMDESLREQVNAACGTN